MGSTAKALVALCLIINCVLWSQSRYAQPSYEYEQTHQISLWRRNEFSALSTDVLSNETECRPLDFEVIPDQCLHVHEECPTSDSILSIPYLQIYFCADSPLRPFIFAALLVWLAFLFSTLGMAASDFFTPNLATISHFLGLGEDVAGVTLLAFGNASPDVFGTFSAMRANSGGLAIGELLGAASFIVSCVVGSMCIIRPFKVEPIPFLRDVGFFTLTIGLLLFILRDGLITKLEAAFMVLWYIFYAFTVVVGGWWFNRREKKRRVEAIIRREYLEESGPERYTDLVSPAPPTTDSLSVPLLSPTNIRSISAPTVPRVQTQFPVLSTSRTPSPITSPSHIARMPSFSLVGAVEFQQVVSSLRSQAASSSLHVFDSPVTPYAGGHYLRPHHRRASSASERVPEVEEWEGALGVPLNEHSPKLLRTSITEGRDGNDRGGLEGTLMVVHDEEDAHTPLSVPTIPSISHIPPSPTSSEIITEVEDQAPPTRQQNVQSVLARAWHLLFPSLHHFKSKTLIGKTVSLLAAPAVMALTLTLPVVVHPYGIDGWNHEKDHHIHDSRLSEFEEEDVERALLAEHEVQEELHGIAYNKWLMAVQCIFGPLFCISVLFNGSKNFVWLLIGTGIGGFAMAMLVLVFTNSGLHPMAQKAVCTMSFIVSVVWIMAIADETVNVLRTIGFIIGLSDGIIGLTIFAVGNSFADLVANTSVAVFAPIMGFSACFGGPMVNILLGIGISGSYVINQNGGTPYNLHTTPTITTSTVGLLTLLIITLVTVPLNGYFLSRRWGVFLVVAYMVLMSVNMLVELGYDRG